MKAKFFPRASDFRKWLEKNHKVKDELVVGFYKKNSGKPSITWPESVDQALCFGWIDGIRKSLDEISYSIRFTPRRASSHWSNVNINRIKELCKEGLVFQAGEEAFSKREKHKSGKAAYEQKDIELDSGSKKAFKSNKKAWKYFQSQAPWYIKSATWWVINAKQESTRLKRLEILIQDSENGLRIKQFRRN